MTIKISGGFHNVPEFTMRAPEVRPGGVRFSPGQWRKAQKRCCGIASCTCGGFARADVIFADGTSCQVIPHWLG